MDFTFEEIKMYRLFKISALFLIASPFLASASKWIRIQGTVAELVDNRVVENEHSPSGINHGSIYVTLAIFEPVELQENKIIITLKESESRDAIPKIWHSKILELEIFTTIELLADPNFSYYETASSIRKVKPINSNQSVDTTRVSARRNSNTPDILNLNPTFEL